MSVGDRSRTAAERLGRCSCGGSCDMCRPACDCAALTAARTDDAGVVCDMCQPPTTFDIARRIGKTDAALDGLDAALSGVRPADDRLFVDRSFREFTEIAGQRHVRDLANHFSTAGLEARVATLEGFVVKLVEADLMAKAVKAAGETAVVPGRERQSVMPDPEPREGTWAWAERQMELNQHVRRHAWAGIYLRLNRLRGSIVMCSPPGTARFETLWTPSKEDMAALDWGVSDFRPRRPAPEPTGARDPGKMDFPQAFIAMLGGARVWRGEGQVIAIVDGEKHACPPD
jgi:hypothetical protein